MDTTAGPEPVRSMRFVFEYGDGKISLVLQQPVDAAVSGFDVHPDLRPGDYVEVRDSEGGMLSRVPVRPGMAASAEVFPENAGEPITRVDRAQARGAFTVVAPAPQSASQVAVVRVPAPGAPLQAGAEAAPAAEAPAVTDLATFALDTRSGGQRR